MRDLACTSSGRWSNSQLRCELQVQFDIVRASAAGLCVDSPLSAGWRILWCWSTLLSDESERGSGSVLQCPKARRLGGGVVVMILHPDERRRPCATWCRHRAPPELKSHEQRCGVPFVASSDICRGCDVCVSAPCQISRLPRTTALQRTACCTSRQQHDAPRAHMRTPCRCASLPKVTPTTAAVTIPRCFLVGSLWTPLASAAVVRTNRWGAPPPKVLRRWGGISILAGMQHNRFFLSLPLLCCFAAAVLLCRCSCSTGATVPLSPPVRLLSLTYHSSNSRRLCIVT